MPGRKLDLKRLEVCVCDADWCFVDLDRMKHSSGDARIRVTIDDYSHQTHEKTRNIVFIFV